jgi:hypothetical protein
MADHEDGVEQDEDGVEEEDEDEEEGEAAEAHAIEPLDPAVIINLQAAVHAVQQTFKKWEQQARQGQIFTRLYANVLRLDQRSCMRAALVGSSGAGTRSTTRTPGQLN